MGGQVKNNNNKYSIFTHVDDNCMNYAEHTILSLTLSSKLFIGSIKAFIHAFIPNAYTSSSSDLVKELDAIISSAGCNKIKD